jgi:hypothetical protein
MDCSNDSSAAAKAEAAKKQKEAEEAAAAAAAAKQAEQRRLSRTQAPVHSPQQAPRKYKLLSVHPLLPPNMRREEWALSNFVVDKKLHAGYASEVYRVRMELP